MRGREGRGGRGVGGEWKGEGVPVNSKAEGATTFRTRGEDQLVATHGWRRTACCQHCNSVCTSRVRVTHNFAGYAVLRVTIR